MVVWPSGRREKRHLWRRNLYYGRKRPLSRRPEGHTTMFEPRPSETRAYFKKIDKIAIRLVLV